MERYRGLVAANTSAYAGYDLEVALTHIAALGYRRAEIAAMVGVAEHLTQAQMTAAEAARVAGLLRANGLSAAAFSAHYYLCREDAVEVFTPRLLFAKAIGAGFVNTKAGPPVEAYNFLRNMEVLVRRAEELDITIGLETHGDIVSHGAAAVDAAGRFGPRVILNYDFGNVLLNSGGAVDPAADFAAMAKRVGHLHLKDVRKAGRRWLMTAVGSGLVNYKLVAEVLKGLPSKLPLSVDLPLGIALTEEARVEHLPLLPLEEIDEVMARSLAYLEGVLP